MRCRPAPKYDERTKTVGKFILPLIDRYAWSYTERKTGRVLPGGMPDHIVAYYNGQSYPPQRFTKTQLQDHLHGKEVHHYRSDRRCGFALIRFDIDAHQGQDTVHEAVSLLQRYLPGAYHESSTNHRGWAFYALVHVGRIKRLRFNQIATAACSAFAKLFRVNEIDCTIEVEGLFNIPLYEAGENVNRDTGEVKQIRWCVGIESSQVGALPMLRAKKDVENFLNSPMLLPEHLLLAIHDAEMYDVISTEDFQGQDEYVLEDCASQTPKNIGAVVRSMDDAFWRMNVCCFEYTLEHRRVPSLEQLLNAYAEEHGGEADRDRTRRAKDVLKRRAKAFDPDLVSAGGYVVLRLRLLEAVQTFCLDRRTSYDHPITDEDLAIALYTVQIASFTKKADPKHQYTVGRDAIVGMFRRLKHITGQGCNQNKASALKALLLRAGLIECIEDTYSHGLGINKKYVIGRNHWLREQWTLFNRKITVKSVAQVRAEIPRADVMWEPEHPTIEAMLASTQ